MSRRYAQASAAHRRARRTSWTTDQAERMEAYRWLTLAASRPVATVVYTSADRYINGAADRVLRRAFAPVQGDA